MLWRTTTTLDTFSGTGRIGQIKPVLQKVDAQHAASPRAGAHCPAWATFINAGHPAMGILLWPVIACVGGTHLGAKWLDANGILKTGIETARGDARGGGRAGGIDMPAGPIDGV